MNSHVKVSSRNQISVPAEARKKLGIKPGDRLVVRVQGDLMLVMKEPEDWVEYTRGLGSEIWKVIDPVEYVRAEREAWRD